LELNSLMSNLNLCMVSKFKIDSNFKYSYSKIMLNIDSILANPVSLIKVNQKDDLEKYFLDNSCRVVSVTSSSVELKSKKIKHGSEKNLSVVTSKECCSLISKEMEDSNADFATLLLLNNINICFEEKMMVVLMWIEMFKRTEKRPHLVMTTGTYLIPELPFVLDQKNIYMTEDLSERTELIYHGQNYSPNSGKVIDDCVLAIASKNSENDVPPVGSVWVVFYSGKKKLESLFVTLKNGLDGDADIQVFKNFKRHKRGVRTILLVDKMESCFVSDHVDGVFDCMISEKYGDDSEIFYRHSSKQLSELRSCVLNTEGFCYRMCETDFYESLPKMEMLSLKTDEVVLDSLNYGMSPESFFHNMIPVEEIREEMEKLRIFGLCDLEKITVPGKLALRIPLKYRNSGLLISWMMKEKHIFPCIVAVSLMELEGSLLFFPSRGDRKSHVEKRYGDHLPFPLYLEMINKVLEETGDLRPKNLMTVAKKHGLNYRVLDQLFFKIRMLVDIFSKKKNLEIGLFDSSNLISKLTPYLETYYQDSIYKVSDVDKRIYVSEKDAEAYGLDGHKHFSSSDLPIRIVVFDKSKINDSVDSVQRSRNLIFYFSGI
jgi:hypothetical protein